MEPGTIVIIALICLAAVAAMVHHYNDDKGTEDKKQPVEDAPARPVIPQKTENMPLIVVGATPLTSVQLVGDSLFILFNNDDHLKALDDIQNHMVDILKKIGEYPEKKFLSTEDAEKTVLNQYEALTSDNVFLNPCHRPIPVKYLPAAVLFQPQYDNDYYGRTNYTSVGLEIVDQNSDNFYRKFCHVIGLGGVYFIDVANALESKFLDVNVKHRQTQPWNDRRFFFASNVTIDISTIVTKVVDMPSITQRVIDKMKSKDMTNIPYVGETYRAAGYQVVQVRLDNETYVFCSSKGYLDRMDDFSDVRKDTLVDQLVELRSSRNPELEVTDYGYVWKKDVAPVHWYV